MLSQFQQYQVYKNIQTWYPSNHPFPVYASSLSNQTFYDSSFAVRGPTLWNKVPDSIKAEATFELFKVSLSKFFAYIPTTLRFYGSSLTLETIGHSKGTIETHTTINKQFMADLNIPPRAMRDLTIPTMMLGRHFTVTTPGTDNTAYRDSLQKTEHH